MKVSELIEKLEMLDASEEEILVVDSFELHHFTVRDVFRGEISGKPIIDLVAKP